MTFRHLDTFGQKDGVSAVRIDRNDVILVGTRKDAPDGAISDSGRDNAPDKVHTCLYLHLILFD